MNKRKVVLYISASLDGYISGPDGDMSFLERVQQGSEDYGYHQFYDSVETVVMGRRTFDWVYEQVGNPHPDKEFYVLSKHTAPKINGVHFFSGRPADLVQQLKTKTGGIIYCDGGAQIANELLREGLIDMLVLSLIPVVLGGGTPLFQKDLQLDLNLLHSQSFKSGLVQLSYYIRIKNAEI